MKVMALALFAVLALAGCKDRVIWDDQGKIDEKTENRTVWDSNGKMNTDERKVWENKEGEKVVK